ncbi:MAG: nucleotidyltransferase domain-containing protein, partial [Candidatus Korarchaeota archaeon]|nr:nucleotidyltransferase domain-containing protein [Candidatus Korarchaeota archaeon]
SPLTARFGKDLVSVVVFGSFARGEAKEGSDLDLLIVLKELPREVDRLRLSASVSSLFKPPIGFPRIVSPLIMTEEEIKRHPPILLDMIDGSLILYDEDGFMRKVLRELKRRLEEMGAKKVKVGDGWYWILKQDVKLGEVVKI